MISVFLYITGAYKKFYKLILVSIYNLIRKIIIFVNAKDINVILKLGDRKWRSILFFYTDINLDVRPKNSKNYPVKMYRLAWYIWVMYYIYAGLLMFKAYGLLWIYIFFEYINYKLWCHIWLILLEYWRLRLGIFKWVLHITWGLTYLFFLTEYIIRKIMRDHDQFLYWFLKFIKIYRYFRLYNLNTYKFFWVYDKRWWRL